MCPASRMERDSMGEIAVPVDALWGAQTQRSLEHFAISTERMPEALLMALARIKRAAARVNAELGKLVKSPDVLELFDSLGVFPEHTTPERMLEIVKAEGPPMGKLLKAAGIEPQ